MHLFNLASIGLVLIANLTRFYYFGKREQFTEREVASIDEDGDIVTETVVDKTYARDSFWMMLYTLIVFPIFIFIFIVQELQVTNARLAFVVEHFAFLDYHIGKGLYLLLLISFILQHPYVMQWLMSIVLFVVVVFNLIHPCIFGSNPINGTGPVIGQAQTDKGIMSELKKAEQADAKTRIIKPIDPTKTAQVKLEVEAKGHSIVDEKNMSMNPDKRGGQGTLKVRFQSKNQTSTP